jgi:hypothetical protein
MKVEAWLWMDGMIVEAWLWMDGMIVGAWLWLVLHDSWSLVVARTV